MSAQELREAAALMRSRAKAARAGRWSAIGSEVTAAWQDGPRFVCDSDVMGGPLNAQHIASWHPAVALAVADWLEHDADVHEMLQAAGGRGLRADGQTPNAFTVARAYLGGDQ